MRNFSYPWCAVVLKLIFEDSEEVVTQPVFPVDVSVEKNPYHEADTAKVELNFKDFPLEPRLCKAITLLVHMGCLDTPNESPLVSEDNLIFIGFVDQNSIEFDDSKTKVMLEARDYTSLLIDQKYPEETVNINRPLVDVVEEILSKEEAFGEIEIELRGLDESPTLGDFKSERNWEEATVKEQTFWDLIVDMCQQSGLVCFIENDKLVIQQAQNLVDDSRIEPFIFGQNIKKITVSRDLRKLNQPNIEVRSYDDKQKKTLVGRYPDPPVSKKAIVKEDSKERFEYQRFIVRNINSEDQLKKIAESIYWQVARNEVKGTIETRETKSLLEDNALLMTLAHGKGIYAAFKAEGMFQNLQTSERENYLNSIGFDSKVAKKMASLFDSDKLNGPYYVHKATHSFKNDSGYGLNIEFINFIDVDKDAGSS